MKPPQPNGEIQITVKTSKDGRWVTVTHKRDGALVGSGQRELGRGDAELTVREAMVDAGVGRG